MDEKYNQEFMTPSHQKELFNALEVDQPIKINLAEAAKWAKFMGIIGLIMIVLMALGGIVILFAGSSLLAGSGEIQGMPFNPGFLGVIYFIIALLYFYPTWTLLKFGNLTHLGIKNENQHQFSNGLRNLKNCFKFIGILTVLGIIIYILAIIAIAVGAGIGAIR